MISRIEYIDEERIAIYIGQSIFEADIDTETRYDSTDSMTRPSTRCTSTSTTSRTIL
jgi:hypothetical protein